MGNIPCDQLPGRLHDLQKTIPLQNSLVRYSLKHNCCHRPTTVRTAFFSCCRGIYMYASAGAAAIIFWIASASF